MQRLTGHLWGVLHSIKLNCSEETKDPLPDHCTVSFCDFFLALIVNCIIKTGLIINYVSLQ